MALPYIPDRADPLTLTSNTLDLNGQAFLGSTLTADRSFTQ
jgi:hypothetical protein